MRKLMCVCLLWLFVSIAPVVGQTANPHPLFDTLSSKLRAVKSLSNYDRGFGGTNEFYNLSKVFLRERASEDFERMLDDKNPIVKAMGLLCLAQMDADEYAPILSAHTKDEEEVYLQQGCNVSNITVGEFAQRLIKNPYFLDPEGKSPAMQPSPGRVY